MPRPRECTRNRQFCYSGRTQEDLGCWGGREGDYVRCDAEGGLRALRFVRRGLFRDRLCKRNRLHIWGSHDLKTARERQLGLGSCSQVSTAVLL